MWCLTALVLLLPLVGARNVPHSSAPPAPQETPFTPPSKGPLVPSPNYGNPSNTTLPKRKFVQGAAFDRIHHIWLENKDFEPVATSKVFRKLAKEGISLTQYHGLTHPSEPNYCAAAGGSFFGMADDNLHRVPPNVSSIVDLLEDKNISWASYQESMPSDGDQNFSESLPNYVNKSAPPYPYYVRKHDMLILYDSVATVQRRAALVRNFNDFIADVKADVVPQWTFITPNMLDDGHDTSIDYINSWLEFWLIPLLGDKRFNDDRTIISLTFDEDDSDGGNNRVTHLLLGGAIPKHLHGTEDPIFFTHYSGLSTVQSNWGLGCLGRGDTNKTLSNVYSFVAEKTGYKNLHIPVDQIPLLNASGTTPGPFNPHPSLFEPFPPANTSAVCAGGGAVIPVPTITT